MWFKTIYFLCLPFHKVNLCDLVLGYTYYCILLINHEYISIACCLSCLRILKHYLLATMACEPEKWGVKYVGGRCGLWNVDYYLGCFVCFAGAFKTDNKAWRFSENWFCRHTSALAAPPPPPSESVAPNLCA